MYTEVASLYCQGRIENGPLLPTSRVVKSLQLSTVVFYCMEKFAHAVLPFLLVFIKTEALFLRRIQQLGYDDDRNTPPECMVYLWDHHAIPICISDVR